MRERGPDEAIILKKEGGGRVVTEHEGIDAQEEISSQPTHILASQGADEVRRYIFCKRKETRMGQ